MNKQQILAIYKVIGTTYPNFYKKDTEEDMKDFINLWSMMFQDDNPRLVTEAVKTAIQTCEYPPTIAHIKKAIKTMQNGGKNNFPSEEEAWNNVHKALCNSNYNSVDEFNKLDENVKRLIGSHTVLKEYSRMDTIQLNTVVKSNFMRSYKSIISEKKDFDKLPRTAKLLSKELSCNERLKIEDKEVARSSKDQRIK